MKCNAIEIIQRIDSGLLSCANMEFKYDKFDICIDQYAMRKILIRADSTTDFDELYSLFCSLERLVVLLEGQFLKLNELNILDANGVAISCDDFIMDVKQEIVDEVAKYESRIIVSLNDIDIQHMEDTDRNSYHITINYTVKNTNLSTSTDIILEERVVSG